MRPKSDLLKWSQSGIDIKVKFPFKKGTYSHQIPRPPAYPEPFEPLEFPAPKIASHSHQIGAKNRALTPEHLGPGTLGPRQSLKMVKKAHKSAPFLVGMALVLAPVTFF